MAGKQFFLFSLQPCLMLVSVVVAAVACLADLQGGAQAFQLHGPVHNVLFVWPLCQLYAPV